jgi:hypothetical protein
MSIYDQRDKSAYGILKVDPHYSKNPLILKWWTSLHDQILAEQIVRKQWVWFWDITDEVVKITPTAEIEAWQNVDPLCSQYAWYNVLMYFAMSRAEQLGLTKVIRKPEWKTCPLCNQKFVEDSLPVPLVQRLGIDHLDFCTPCLRDTILQGSGDDTASDTSILEYLQNLASFMGRVPTQNFGEGITDLLEIQPKDRIDFLRLLLRKPTVHRVKTVFGSWLNALIQAGVLEDGTRRTSRGIQSIANDGHVCLSLGEKTIDEFLYAHRVYHEKEPRYPEGNFRGDFKVGEVFIEYFGLVGNPEYDARIKEKARICKKYGIILVAIYPLDLVYRNKIESKLAQFIVLDSSIVIPRLITELSRAGILGLQEYKNRLLNNASSEDNFRDLLFEADVALMFSHNGFQVTIRERPDIMIERNGEVVYAEVKHFRKKRQDFLDEKAMRESDTLIPVGRLTSTENSEAWDQIVDVAIQKKDQFLDDAPNLLVIATSSNAVKGIKLQTAANIYEEKALIKPGFRKLNAFILIDQWVDISRNKNVYFCPIACPTIRMSESLVNALEDIQYWETPWEVIKIRYY